MQTVAARFVLPGLGPDVDQAIRLACDRPPADVGPDQPDELDRRLMALLDVRSYR